jgi:hypothetical protein
VEDRILQDVKRYLETISEVLKHARDTNSTKCKIYGNAYTSDYVNYANAYLIECNKYVTNFVQIIDNIDDVVEDNSLNEIIKFFENSKIDGWIAFKPDDIDDDTDDTNDDEVAYEQDYDPYSQYEQK